MTDTRIITVGKEDSGLGRAARHIERSLIGKAAGRISLSFGMGSFKLSNSLSILRLLVIRDELPHRFLSVGIFNPLILLFGKPVDVVIFDAYCFSETGLKAWVQRLMYQICLRRARNTFCVSDWVHRELQRFIRVDLPVSFEYDASFFAASAEIEKQSNRSDRIEVLVVTTCKPNKNNALVRQIIVANEEANEYFIWVVGNIGLQGRFDNTVCLNFVSNALLDLLYDRCSVFMLPSRSEGLSYPAVDAWLNNMTIVSLDLEGLAWLDGYEKWVRYTREADIFEYFISDSGGRHEYVG